MNHSNISAKDIVKIYDRRVLDGVSLSISQQDRIALVGENGAGKTTLLKILSGQEKPDKGKIEQGGWKIMFLVPQEFITKPGRTVEQYLGQTTKKAAKLLHEIGYSQEFLNRQVDDLSGGEKRTIELSRALAKQPDFLFLDEPENHLDYWTREWLANHLEKFHGGIIFVSHDQWFIDQIANKIIEIDDGEIDIYPNGYQEYLMEKAERLNAKMRQWSDRDKEIKRHKKMLVELRQQLKISDRKAGTYRSKTKHLEHLKTEQTKRPIIERAKIKIEQNQIAKKNSKMILSLKNLELGFNKLLFKNVALSLFFGEKVAFIGRNGSGKTSLFRIIQGDLQPNAGNVQVGTDVKPAFFSQEHLTELDSQSTPLQTLRSTLLANEEKCRVILANFLIKEDKASRPISSLSGGEKSRLRFAMLFSQNPEFVLLDEPTNHLDRTSWEVLAEAIKNFKGTVLLTSHDRQLIDQIFKKLWVIEDNQIKEFLGKFSEYLRQQKNH